MSITPRALARMPLGKAVDFRHMCVKKRVGSTEIIGTCKLVRWAFRDEEGFVRFSWYDTETGVCFENFECQ